MALSVCIYIYLRMSGDFGSGLDYKESVSCVHAVIIVIHTKNNCFLKPLFWSLFCVMCIMAWLLHKMRLVNFKQFTTLLSFQLDLKCLKHLKNEIMLHTLF